MRARDLGELVRLPAALTVPGDGWNGAAWSAGGSATGRAWSMPLASTLLYWGGMALNDWADREVDAVERPERPVPSGRVPAPTALGVAVGLGAAGVAVSAVVGGTRALRVSVPLAALVYAYDVVAKDSPAGPFVMASTRGLDVLLGAYADPRAALAPAVAMTTHTLGLTALSRGEVHGAEPRTAVAVTAGTGLVAAATALGAVRAPGLRRRDRLATVGLAAAYASVVGRAQASAAREPSAATVRSATRTGIGGFALLQAAWLARRGRLAAAATVVGAAPALRAAGRWVSPT